MPLLPRPIAPVPEEVQVQAQDLTPAARRSVRLGAKPCLPAMDKAIWVLNKKMGIDMADELPVVAARKLYVDTYKTTMTGQRHQALSKLFRLTLPCLTDVDDALVAMAGPGGVELNPVIEQELSA